MRFGGPWQGFHEAADGWLNSTIGVSLGDVTLWVFVTLAAIIAILFYRALRRSRRVAAFWGCVVGALCLVAGVIHAFWLAQEYVNWPQYDGAQIDGRAIADALPPAIGAAMIFAIGGGAILSALQFRENREVEEDRAICKAHAVSARAGFLASLSREPSGFSPAIQVLFGVPAFFIFLVFYLFEIFTSDGVYDWIRSSQEGSFTVRIRHGPDFPADPDGTLSLRFGETGLRGVGSWPSMTRAQSVIKVRELAALFVSEHGRGARIIFVPGPETRLDQLIEMMDAASAGGVEHLEVSTAPAFSAP